MVNNFYSDEAAWQAVEKGVALCDRSHWGLLQLKGDDRARFLHNQTTNDINRLQPGEGCETVFVTSTGRTIDLATAYVTEEAILVIVSPNRRQHLMAWMDRFLFPMDRVELADISEKYAIFTLIGSESSSLLQNTGIGSILEQPEASHAITNLGEIPIRIGVGSGLMLPGYTLIVAAEQAASLWSQLIVAGAVPMSDRVWQQLRIQQGRPMSDHELTDDYNPLEAGLWQTISFDKGCYIGQETIARLNTYKGVKQRLWGIKLSQAVAPGTIITLAGDKVGILTSYSEIAAQPFGLGYIRTKSGREGLTVQVGEARGDLVSVPFLRHE